MKKIFIALIALTMSVSAVAGHGESEKQTVSAEKTSGYQLLDLVVGIKSTYSKAAELEAKVIELLGGDGMNPTRMALAVNTGIHGDSKVFMLDSIMMSEVTRITFLAKDVIVINFNYDTFDFSKDDAGTQIVAKGSVKITVKRNGIGEISDKIEVENTTKY